MRLTNKQSKGVENHIIKAVAVLGPTAKPSEILRFLHDKEQASSMTAALLGSRLSRLKLAGRVSLQNGIRDADGMKKWLASIAGIVLGQGRQLGVRGVFYLAVAAGLCEKTEAAYQSVVKALDRLRMSGEVAFDRIIDAGRTIHPHGLDARSPVVDLMTNATDYDAIQTYIESTVNDAAEEEPRISAPERPEYYQAADPDNLSLALMQSEQVQDQIDNEPWDGCDAVPFIICEKEGLSGIIEPVCYRYDVPFVAVRGGASITILHDIWELLQTSNIPWKILTLYDYDKAGLDIEHAAMNRLRAFDDAFGGEAEWTSERIAVTPDQVDELELPMRPEKNGDGEAVELDAIPPDTLAEIVEEAIKACIPEDIEERREAAREDAKDTHRLRVNEMVDAATQDYEPQRNVEMEEYVEEWQPQFDDLIEDFRRGE